LEIDISAVFLKSKPEKSDATYFDFSTGINLQFYQSETYRAATLSPHDKSTFTFLSFATRSSF
jgi:hypothetical protein